MNMTKQKVFEIIVPSVAITRSIALTLANLLETGLILLLEGNLGSGKTTFVQVLGEGLGISTAITSPTFTLIDEYTDGRIPLYHMDLYRLDPAQVKHLHLQEYWRGIDFPLGIVAIEWSERLGMELADYLKIELSLQKSDREEDLDRRLIKFKAQGDRSISILTSLEREIILTS